jgi:tetratricopeptide (TPR) repeat protein
VVAIVVVGPWLPAAGADETPAPQAAGGFKEHYERAVILYKSGQYQKSIEEFQAAYEARPQPLLLFNLAQAHRKAGHPTEAQDLYERFLREAPDTDLRAETEGYLAEIRAELLQMKKAMEAAEKAREEATAREERAPKEQAPGPAPHIAKTPPGPRRPFRIARWVLAGAGLVAIVAGATLWALDGRPTCALLPGQKLCPQELDTQNTGIGVLVGGLLLGGGAGAMFAVDYRQARSMPKESAEGQRTAPYSAWLAGGGPADGPVLVGLSGRF